MLYKNPFKKEDVLYGYFQTLLCLNESTEDYLYLWDLKQAKLFFSKDLATQFPIHLEQHAITFKEMMNMVVPSDREMITKTFERIVTKKDEQFQMNYRVLDKNGQPIWINDSGNRIQDETLQTDVMIGRISLSVMYDRIDSLTGLLNTKSLLQDLKHHLTQHEEGALVLFDVDAFKDLNTSKGREYGNTILKEICYALNLYGNDQTHFYRLDGDCFAIDYIHAQKKDLLTLYKKIQNHMQKHCTISAGVAMYGKNSSIDEGTLLLYAESALDQAKQQGKNQIRFFRSDDYQKHLYRIELLEELKKSIANDFDGFYLYYQPQVSTYKYEVKGAEALLRYTSKKYGTISPVEFIPLLEQSRMIIEVGNWVVKEALRQCKKWQVYRSGFCMSINLSYLQIADASFSQYLLDLVNELEIEANTVTLEVTESMQLQDYENYNQLFYLWGKRGIQVAIDDFGTGYSNFSYLKNLAVDEIKIDRSFIQKIHKSDSGFSMLRNMIEFAKTAKVRVCCEGMETIEELHVLETLKPELLQGYYFSHPLNKETFENLFILHQSEEEKWKQHIQVKTEEAKPLMLEDVTNNNFKNVLDQLDEVVYISDMETNEMYYMNSSGKRLSGVSDYAGKKCYEILQRMDRPCTDCVKKDLHSKNFSISYFHNQYLQSQMLLKDKEIIWNEKPACLQQGYDFSSFDKFTQKREQKLLCVEQLLETSMQFQEYETAEDGIAYLLKQCGSYYYADRSYVFLYSQSDDTWCNLYEWCEEKIKSQQLNLLSVSGDQPNVWKEPFAKQGYVVVENIDIYKETQPELWKTLNFQEIVSLILVPIYHKGTLIGFCGVDNPKYMPNDSFFLKNITRMIQTVFQGRYNMDAKDEMIRTMSSKLNEEDILMTTKLGLWIIEMDSNTNTNRMYVDHSMNDILGVSGSLNSEGYYDYWYSRINGGYYNYVNKAVKDMIETGNIIEIEYTWNHPLKGEVPVRCVGAISRNENGVVVLKGYHRILGDMLQESFLEHSDDVERFEYSELKHTIYFHSKRSFVEGEKRKETNFPDCWLENGMVHPYFVESFQTIFTDVKDVSGKQSLDLLMKNKKHEYDWFRLETEHIGTQKEDIHTLIVTLLPIHEKQTLQQRYLIKEDFYRAMLSETDAYMEVDLTNGMIQSSGGFWADYKEIAEKNQFSYMELIDRYISQVVVKEDRKQYYEFLSDERMRLAYEKGETTCSMQCQRIVENGNYHWMEVVVHVFKEKITENMYALLYLKDIDSSKKIQLEQEKAASRDPLTNVLNRRMFEYHVNQYIQTEAKEHEKCAMLLFDLDNFKGINDTFGHQSGDRVLNTLTNVLCETFRKTDFIGRLGGDEFVVFIKNYASKEIMNQRYDKIAQTLAQTKPIPFSCSIGIYVSEKETFCYADSIRYADEALYISKRDGKGRYTYWEEKE